MSHKRILAVLSGGGAPGLCKHAGMLSALESHGIWPTHWSGTSAGAIAAAMAATCYSGKAMKTVLYGLTDDSIRQPRPFWKARLLWLDSIMESGRVLGLLDSLLPSGPVSNLSVWATDMTTWKPCNLAQPQIRLPDAVLASMSVPSIFPAVRLGGCVYQDGGLRFNVPLPSDWQTYDEVYILIASAHPRVYQGGVPILTQAVRAINVLMYDQIGDVLEQTAGDSRVSVIWPKVSSAKGLTHLDHDLIAQAEALTNSQLERNQQ